MQSFPQLPRRPDGRIATSTGLNSIIDFINNGGAGGFTGSGNAHEPFRYRPFFIAKVTSNAAGGEKYNGKTIDHQDAANTATGNLSESDLGTLADSEDCLLYNLEGVGASTHILTDGGNTPYALCMTISVTDDEKPVAAILSLLSEDCP